MKNLVFLLSFFLLSLSTQATIIVVDSTNNAGYGSLRAAIDSASNGDTIRFNPNLIALGSDSIVLDSRINFSKALTFIGLYTPTDTLFISGGGTSRVFKISNTTKILLDSMVIINGFTNDFSWGGAVTMNPGDSLIIENSIFRNNEAYHGGAVFLQSATTNANLIIRNSKFTANQSVGSYARGGAICCQSFGTNNAVVQIFQTTIKHNSAAYNGGGVFCSSSSQNSSINVANCNISGNIAEQGAGICASGSGESTISVQSSTIDHNKGTIPLSSGIGVFCFSFSEIASIDINESTITYNKSDSCWGGGVYISSNQKNSNLNIINSTIAYNDGYQGGGIYHYSGNSALNSFNIKSSIIALNGSSNIEANHWNAMTSLGDNIFSTMTMVGAISSDSINQDSTAINLGPLAFNGGNTLTMMPIFPSVAINNGNPLDSIDAQNAHVSGIREVGAAEVCFATYGIDTIIGCDQFTWINGITYVTNDSTATYNLANAAGCDSIVTLNLTIISSSTHTDSITACGSYTWTDGITYNINNSTAKDTLVNAVGCDSIITLNLTILPLSFSVDTVVACDSYTWVNGVTYSSSNTTAQDTLTNAIGCDSIITLNLTINPLSFATDTIAACTSYTWINGTTYTASNTTDKDTLVNALGCDSIVTLNLTILNITYGTEVITVCDSYLWNGITYTSSNTTALDTLVNAAGCDSIVTLNLTLNSSSSAVDVISACESYTWIDGITYTASNTTAQDTLTNALGCDSVITLNLTINTPTLATDYQSACVTYTWINGVTYNANNTTAKDTLTNVAGCDSIITLNLTINPTNAATFNHTACDSYTWINGVTYTSSTSTAKDTLLNVNGCDSIITLNLTILNSSTGTEVVTACDSYLWYGNTYTASTTTAQHTLTNAAGCDSIVSLNLTINATKHTTDIFVVCDSMTWIDGNTYYTTSNTTQYVITGGAASGCDSIVTLNLTVNSSATVDVVSACVSHTWINGVTFTASNNTATHTMTNALGCDSVISLSLTISPITYGIETVSACGSYMWNGITYTTNNTTALDTIINTNGCDSIVTLNLTILNPSSGAEVISACGNYTWNGITYTTSNNTGLDTLVNAAGCDSLVTLNLTILSPSIGMDIITVCDSFTWNGITYSSSTNIPTMTLVNSVGCDSIITLDLTILNSSSSTNIITACDTYTWIDGITYTSSTNSPTYTIPNAAGCDSVITLNLTITEVDTSVISQNLILTAQASNATFRWLDCLNNNQPIANQTTNIFPVTQSGNYAVEVTQNGCLDTSACFEFTNVGIAEMELMGISLYPNPTSDFLHIDKGTNQSLDIVITNSSGGEVFRTTSNNQITLIDLSQFATGIYVVTMQNQDGFKMEQVVKR